MAKRRLMHAQQALEAFRQSGSTATPEVQAALASPEKRRELYRLLVSEPPPPFSRLVREAFRREIAYREQLWEGTLEDEDDFFEGIYHCAFLVYRLASLDDVAVLWRAKHLNMDVGVSMGAQFFVGAGVDETIAFLERADLPEASDMADYLRRWFADPEARQWQQRWEEEMISAIQGG